MKNIIRNTAILTLGILICASLMSFIKPEPSSGKWNIPEEYQKMKNPLKRTPENMKMGKQLYDRHCASCHGETGNGDGEKVRQLVMTSVRPANFKLEDFKKEAEGVHFYKIKFGKSGLHSFKGKIEDEDIWGIILQISTFR